jgi:predicted DNA-binding antitoxin AbrB/MazE fold protein
MPLTIAATYENGNLKLEQPLPLPEHAKVRITVETSDDAVRRVRETAGIIPCRDPHLIELAALDPELSYSPMEEQ